MPTPEMEPQRWVAAPGCHGQIQPGKLTGIFLGEGENVRWSWTFGTNGSQVVTGYEIITKKKIKTKKWRMGFALGKG